MATYIGLSPAINQIRIDAQAYANAAANSANAANNAVLTAANTLQTYVNLVLVGF